MRLLAGSIRHKIGIYVSSSDADRFERDPFYVFLKKAILIFIYALLTSLPILIVHYIAEGWK